MGAFGSILGLFNLGFEVANRFSINELQQAVTVLQQNQDAIKQKLKLGFDAIEQIEEAQSNLILAVKNLTANVENLLKGEMLELHLSISTANLLDETEQALDHAILGKINTELISPELLEKILYLHFGKDLYQQSIYDIDLSQFYKLSSCVVLQLNSQARTATILIKFPYVQSENVHFLLSHSHVGFIQNETYFQVQYPPFSILNVEKNNPTLSDLEICDISQCAKSADFYLCPSLPLIHRNQANVCHLDSLTNCEIEAKKLSGMTDFVTYRLNKFGYLITTNLLTYNVEFKKGPYKIVKIENSTGLYNPPEDGFIHFGHMIFPFQPSVLKINESFYIPPPQFVDLDKISEKLLNMKTTQTLIAKAERENTIAVQTLKSASDENLLLNNHYLAPYTNSPHIVLAIVGIIAFCLLSVIILCVCIFYYRKNFGYSKLAKKGSKL